MTSNGNKGGEVSGRPRPFIEMKLNRRCSVLFHLEVPGR